MVIFSIFLAFILTDSEQGIEESTFSFCMFPGIFLLISGGDLLSEFLFTDGSSTSYQLKPIKSLLSPEPEETVSSCFFCAIFIVTIPDLVVLLEVS